MLLEQQKIKDNYTMVFQIRLAGKVIEIHAFYEYIYTRCRKYVISDQVILDPDIIITVSQGDLTQEEHRMKIAMQAGKTEVYTEADPEYLETLVVYRKIAEEMLHYRTILMHGSVIATEGVGYMITAPKGVGKTTRTRIWVNNIPGSVVVNGDKPLIKVSSKSVYACGTPWGGKEEWHNNIIVPLRAIFLLERADEGEGTLIEELSLGRAFSPLVRQTYQAKGAESIRKTMQLIKAFDGKVKFYRFRSAPTVEDVRMAFEAAKL